MTTRVPERDFTTEDLLINVGPQHPSTHGVFRMIVDMDGEVVQRVIPHIGYMHRGGEKLCETMDYRQGIGYMDRTEYLGQFNAELSYVMAVEKLAELEVPDRAIWIRTILAELNRISSHMMFMGAFGEDVGIFGTPFMFAWRVRERIYDLFEEVSGERMMYAYFRPGGVAWDLPENFVERTREVLRDIRQGVDDFDGLMTRNEVFIARTKNVGVLTAEEAIELGTTGPILRASGVPMDLRREEPYMKYDELEFDVIVGQNGDVFDRYMIRLEEMRESAKIVEQALERLEPGPIMPERMPRMLRTPPGEVYMRTEAPRGEYGVYIVSKGGNRPHRCKIRSSCFANLQALEKMCVGYYFQDALAALGSIDLVMCEVDR